MLLKRILIVSEHGLPVFDFEEYSRGDEVLVSGLITAILKFVEETEKERLSRVMLEESQYLLTAHDSLIFIFQVSDEMPEEYAEYVSDCVAKNFINKYKDEIKEFSGDVSVFRGFQEDCKQILLQCGVEAANILVSATDNNEIKAWCVLSNENELLVVRAIAPNYNIDSFTIFQVLGKSLRKVTSDAENITKSNSFHITHQGNVIQTINLPSAIIILEAKVDDLIVQRYRQFKTKSHKQVLSILKEAYKPDRTEIYNRNLVSPVSNKEISKKHKLLYDFFQAAEKGLNYLFNSPIHVQIFSTDEQSTVVIKLINRIFFLDFENGVSSTQLIEATRKFFEQEITIKDDIPEVMLEKS